MGFNFSGIAINKNMSNDFEVFLKAFHWDLEFVSELDFQSATSNVKEEDEYFFDFYFSEQATLLFLNYKQCTEAWPLPNLETLTFSYNETSMAFYLAFCVNDVTEREIMAVNDDVFISEGKPLPVEIDAKDTSDVIWKQLEVVLGKSFFEIESDAVVLRYKRREIDTMHEFVPQIATSTEHVEHNEPDEYGMTRNVFQETKKRRVASDEPVLSKPQKSVKGWWEFWK